MQYALYNLLDLTPIYLCSLQNQLDEKHSLLKVFVSSDTYQVLSSTAKLVKSQSIMLINITLFIQHFTWNIFTR